MALVTVIARQRKMKTDQQGTVVNPATDVIYDGTSLDVNPVNVAWITTNGVGPNVPDSDYYLVTMVGGHTFYVDAADKALLDV